MRRDRGQLWKKGMEEKSGEASGPGGGEKGLEDPDEVRGKEDEGSQGRGSVLVTFHITEMECLAKTPDRRKSSFWLTV